MTRAQKRRAMTGPNRYGWSDGPKPNRAAGGPRQGFGSNVGAGACGLGERLYGDNGAAFNLPFFACLPIENTGG